MLDDSPVAPASAIWLVRPCYGSPDRPSKCLRPHPQRCCSPRGVRYQRSETERRVASCCPPSTDVWRRNTVASRNMRGRRAPIRSGADIRTSLIVGESPPTTRRIRARFAIPPELSHECVLHLGRCREMALERTAAVGLSLSRTAGTATDRIRPEEDNRSRRHPDLQTSAMHVTKDPGKRRYAHESHACVMAREASLKRRRVNLRQRCRASMRCRRFAWTNSSSALFLPFRRTKPHAGLDRAGR